MLLKRVQDLYLQNSEKSVVLEASRIYCALIRSLAFHKSPNEDELMSAVLQASNSDMETIISMMFKLLAEKQHQEILSAEAIFTLVLIARDVRACNILSQKLEESEDILSNITALIQPHSEFSENLKKNAKTLVLVVGQNSQLVDGNLYSTYRQIIENSA